MQRTLTLSNKKNNLITNGQRFEKTHHQGKLVTENIHMTDTQHQMSPGIAIKTAVR